MVLISFSSFATNVARGIYADSADGLKQCLEDVSNGSAVGYTPTLKNPITSTDFEIKKVGAGGACLTKARVTGDGGKGLQVATVAVAEGFGYGVLEKNGSVVEYRMKACSNHFGGIFVPKAKVAEKQPEATPAPAPVAQPSVVQNTTVIAIVETPSAPAVTTPPASECKDCTPNRKTEEGKGGWCRLEAGKPACNFEWKVLSTQNQIKDCGCQAFIPETKQIIGFLDAMPGSPRCRQQKRMWAKALGREYNNSRPPQ